MNETCSNTTLENSTSDDKLTLIDGAVKWFSDSKGFGFIEHTDGRDVFVHFSVIDCEGFRTLKDGEKVKYAIEEGEKGLHAVKVLRNKPKKSQNNPANESNVNLAGQIEVIKTDDNDHINIHNSDSLSLSKQIEVSNSENSKKNAVKKPNVKSNSSTKIDNRQE